MTIAIPIIICNSVYIIYSETQTTQTQRRNETENLAHMKMESLSTTQAASLKGRLYALWRRYLWSRDMFLSSFVDA